MKNATVNVSSICSPVCVCVAHLSKCAPYSCPLLTARACTPRCFICLPLSHPHHPAAQKKKKFYLRKFGTRSRRPLIKYESRSPGKPRCETIWRGFAAAAMAELSYVVMRDNGFVPAAERSRLSAGGATQRGIARLLQPAPPPPSPTPSPSPSPSPPGTLKPHRRLTGQLKSLRKIDSLR